jgi:GxxExxY protein
MEIKQEFFPLAGETEIIIRLGIEVHKTLGIGFSEVVYKDALEYEFAKNNIFYEREKMYDVPYKTEILPHKFFADFVVFDSVILEIKAKNAIANEDLAQTINYLKCSGCCVGLILNFGKGKLDIKRVLL